MNANRKRVLALAATLLAAAPAGAAPLVIDFESVPLGPLGFDNGENAGGSFDVGGAVFNNGFDTRFGSWSGWSFSRTTDTTNLFDPGSNLLNQFSAYTNLPDGGGADGSEQYAVAFSAPDGGNPAGLRPTIQLPAGSLPSTVEVANTTFAAISVLEGSNGIARPFGEGDTFRLTVSAVDAQQQTLGSLDVFLADFRDGQELLVSDWTEIDLSSLQVDGVTGLRFQLTTTDIGPAGPNTPAYVAIDNLVLATPAAGDANHDGFVNAADYAALRDTGAGSEAFAAFRSRFGAAATLSELATAQTTRAATAPEPGSLAIGLAGLLAVSAWRRRPVNDSSPS